MLRTMACAPLRACMETTLCVALPTTTEITDDGAYYPRLYPPTNRCLFVLLRDYPLMVMLNTREKALEARSIRWSSGLTRVGIGHCPEIVVMHHQSLSFLDRCVGSTCT